MRMLIFFLFLTSTVSAQFTGNILCSINDLQTVTVDKVEVTAQNISVGNIFDAPVQYYTKAIVNDCIVYDLCGEGFTATYTVCDQNQQLYIDNGCIIKLKNQSND
jgi:hypothetical protein